MPRSKVQIKRAYESASRGDGYRVLVDRLWPRGMRKTDLELDAWLKAVAPSAELRRWFGHEPDRFPEFSLRYRHELQRTPAAEALAELVQRAAGGPLTLVYGARDETHNGAVVLRAEIEAGLARQVQEQRPPEA